MQEIWKDVVGYEGLYQVSNLGRVKSYDKQWFCGLRGTSLVTRDGRVLIPQLKKGYCVVNLYNKDGMKSKTVHRLIAISFIENPDNKPQVNHIDYNKQNNNISNLEWVTGIENSRHSFDNYIDHSLAQLKKINDSGINRKPIFMMDLEGTILREFESASAASIEMCGSVTATIFNQIKGHNKTAYGYKWAYKEI